MKLKFLSWNIRGANNLEKRKIIRKFVKLQRMDLACLQETKIKDLSPSCSRSLRVGRYANWKAVKAKGTIGGILLFWDI